jgi:hypothetical protein
LATRRYKSHPQSAPGDFYVVEGECITCGAPHAVAPDLIGWVDGDHSHCIWKKQPETEQEIEQAIAVTEASEVGCHRYAGDDPKILRRIDPEYCDAVPKGRSAAFRPWSDETISTPNFLTLPPTKIERILAVAQRLFGTRR